MCASRYDIYTHRHFTANNCYQSSSLRSQSRLNFGSASSQNSPKSQKIYNNHTSPVLNHSLPPFPSSSTMAKEKPSAAGAADSSEPHFKKDKKEKKKRSETDGIHKSSSSSKKKEKSEKSKEKKDEKKKKHRSKEPAEVEEEQPPTTTDAIAPILGQEAEDAQMTTRLLNSLEEEKPGSVAVKEDGGEVVVKVKNVGDKPFLVGALVPFANPLADEKVGRKVLKGVKRGVCVFLIFPMG